VENLTTQAASVDL